MFIASLPFSPRLCVLVGRNGAGGLVWLMADGCCVVDGVVNFRGAGVSKAAGIARLGCASSVSISCGGSECGVCAELLLTRTPARYAPPSAPHSRFCCQSWRRWQRFFGIRQSVCCVVLSGGGACVVEPIRTVALAPELCVLVEIGSGLERERVRCYASLVSVGGLELF
ncbi:FeS assembly ATPase SufC [Candidatus Hodgkinia cicadicola]|nr:FeS assembly ATPase SufC [Candidatus Hodgkinia cicadicola]